ncbi:MAG: PIN domain nuclease [Solirubrobacteraceae bacterium]
MTLLLVDTSAWHRSSQPVVVDAWRAALDADRVAVTGPVRLEVLYSARSAADYERLAGRLDALHQLPCDAGAYALAEYVQRELGRRVALHHRSVKHVDLVIAAVAELAGATVWHYDADYERIADVTGQPTEWIVPRGAL